MPTSVAAVTKVFIDSNVLLYALDAGQPAKRDTAIELLDRLTLARRVVFSTQVFQETYSVSVRKIGLTGAAAQKSLTGLFSYPVVQVDLPLLEAAMQRHQQDKIAFYDALIVESALSGGCAILASEDFQSGRKFGSLRVINPFKEVIT